MEGESDFNPGSARKKVTSACQRCKRQKLKCDVNRPCIMCARAGANCQYAPSTRWRVYQNQQPSESEPAAKRARTTCAEPADGLSPHENTPLQPPPNLQTPLPRDVGPIHPRLAPNDHSWNSSSTMSLVDGAFNLHDAAATQLPATNAIPGGQGTHIESGTSEEETTSSAVRPAQHTRTPIRSRNRLSSSAMADLSSLLPSYEAAALLVDTYFDQVHWFMLIFHQDEFRQRWPKLYNRTNAQMLQSSEYKGFTSTFLMVMAIGLQYVGDRRRRLLSTYGTDPEALQERILSAIKTKLLDIISVGSLEVVQTCVLLGTYYLYHGSPRLAWPVCGCGLRIAQSIGLHRRVPIDSTVSQSADLRKENETRKRSWWAIYEIETFCSMSYGYPHSIRDADCDVEPLDPFAKLSGLQSPRSFDQTLTGETTLLSYKYFMSKLSVLTKYALAELYRVGLDSVERLSVNNPVSSARDTIQKVNELGTKLQQWQAEIPSTLRWENMSSKSVSYSSPDDVDQDIGASGPVFENHIYQLQALALKLAYENATILVHRPLLSYKLVTKSSTHGPNPEESGSTQANPFHLSLQACRNAALSMSEIISSPIVDLVSATYAASFVSIHTFTAGVTLGILSSIEPLTPQSREAKIGLHRLMGIQEKLKTRSVLAAQGLEILQRLTKLVMEKELNVMLDLSNPIQGPCPKNEPSIAPIDDGSPQPSHRNESSHETAPTSNFPPSLINPDQVINMPNSNIIDPNDMLNDSPLQYMEDPALSAALYDFDQVMSSYAPNQQEGPIEDQHASYMGANIDDGIPMLEQTWIWGLDNPPACE